jgi:hypothetical protein
MMGRIGDMSAGVAPKVLAPRSGERKGTHRKAMGKERG